MLETNLHTDNAFVTLTYSDDNLVLGDGRPSLEPVHLQLFLKRLRKSYEPIRLRYFGCGEYGDKTERPHYHLALFNYPTCVYFGSRYQTRASCCENCDRVLAAWGLGHVMLGTLTPDSAQYISGYVTKKMTGKADLRLLGRHPEFARMSLRPGIGAGFVPEIAASLIAHNLEYSIEDVPVALRHGKRLLPLGRYLRGRLREAIGRDKKTPQAVLQAQAAELSAMRKIAWDTKKPLQEVLAETIGSLEDSLSARSKIHKGKGKYL